MRCLSAGQAGDQVGGPVDLFLGVVVVGENRISGWTPRSSVSSGLCSGTVVVTLTPARARAWAACSAATLPILAVTMAQRVCPRSWMVTPGRPASWLRSLDPRGDGTLPDLFQAQVEGLADGGAQAQDVDVAVFPGGRADLGDERVELLQRGGAQPQEPGATRAAQELAAGAGEQVAADRVHIDRELAGRLGGIQQIQRTAAAGDPPDLVGGLDQ